MQKASEKKTDNGQIETEIKYQRDEKLGENVEDEVSEEIRTYVVFAHCNVKNIFLYFQLQILRCILLCVEMQSTFG